MTKTIMTVVKPTAGLAGNSMKSESEARQRSTVPIPICSSVQRRLGRTIRQLWRPTIRGRGCDPGQIAADGGEAGKPDQPVDSFRQLIDRAQRAAARRRRRAPSTKILPSQNVIPVMNAILAISTTVKFQNE